MPVVSVTVGAQSETAVSEHAHWSMTVMLQPDWPSVLFVQSGLDHTWMNAAIQGPSPVVSIRVGGRSSSLILDPRVATVLHTRERTELVLRLREVSLDRALGERDRRRMAW